MQEEVDNDLGHFVLSNSKPALECSSLTLKMASTQVVETSVTNNSPSQDSNHPDDLFQSRYVTPWFKLFSYKNSHNHYSSY